MFPYSMTVNPSTCKIFVIPPHAPSDTRTRVATGETMHLYRQRCPHSWEPLQSYLHIFTKELRNYLVSLKGISSMRGNHALKSNHFTPKAAKPMARAALNVGAHFYCSELRLLWFHSVARR